MDAEFFARDVAAYTTERERAAYRAGMSSAAAICDRIAEEAEDSNTSRKRLTNVGAALVAIAKQCGDEIWKARETIKVKR